VPGGSGLWSISQPQVNTIRRGGSTCRKRPLAQPSPPTFMRNWPPGRGSSSASSPCHCSQRRGSAKNPQTVSGGGGVGGARCAPDPRPLQAAPRVGEEPEDGLWGGVDVALDDEWAVGWRHRGGSG